MLFKIKRKTIECGNGNITISNIGKSTGNDVFISIGYSSNELNSGINSVAIAYNPFIYQKIKYV
jgi:hypothetical protein